MLWGLYMKNMKQLVYCRVFSGQISKTTKYNKMLQNESQKTQTILNKEK